MKNKLRPCPFCGNKASPLHVGLDNTSGYVVECHMCRARTENRIHKESAIEAWNRRVRKKRMLKGR